MALRAVLNPTTSMKGDSGTGGIGPRSDSYPAACPLHACPGSLAPGRAVRPADPPSMEATGLGPERAGRVAQGTKALSTSDGQSRAAAAQVFRKEPLRGLSDPKGGAGTGWFVRRNARQHGGGCLKVVISGRCLTEPEGRSVPKKVRCQRRGRHMSESLPIPAGSERTPPGSGGESHAAHPFPGPHPSVPPRRRTGGFGTEPPSVPGNSLRAGRRRPDNHPWLSGKPVRLNQNIT